jgi:hypothetical protein
MILFTRSIDSYILPSELPEGGENETPYFIAFHARNRGGSGRILAVLFENRFLGDFGHN